MMRSFFLACLLVLAGGCANAEDACPARGEWSAACFEAKGATRQVKPAYRAKLPLQKSGMAVLTISEPRELVAVDRKGVVVIPGIFHTGDFDYPSAEQGVGRFEAGGKCGYFSTATFHALVPAAYDQCQAFHEGEALACKDCVRYCTEDECQDSVLVGGRGFAFDARGKLLREFALPTVDAACGSAAVARVSKMPGAVPRLKCEPGAGSPFKL
jgi:hypothetical protein